MKRLLLAPLLLGFFSPVMGKETCIFQSEYSPNVKIELNTKYLSIAKGFVKHKDEKVLTFETGQSNGFSSGFQKLVRFFFKLSNKRVFLGNETYSREKHPQSGGQKLFTFYKPFLVTRLHYVILISGLLCLIFECSKPKEIFRTGARHSS